MNQSTFEKTPDNKLKEIFPPESKIVVYGLSFLKTQKQQLLDELKKVDLLIIQCQELGVTPDVEHTEPVSEEPVIIP